MGLPPWAESESQWFVMITGANSGLGYSICERTIAEHFTTPSRPSSQHLVLIVSTRSASKALDTIQRLRKYLRRFAEKSQYAVEQRAKNSSREKPYNWIDVVARVHFLNIELDLCDLRGIYKAAARLRGEGEGLSSPDWTGKDGTIKKGLRNVKIPRLDALVLNAGMFEISGLRWGPAVWYSIVDTKETLTWWDHNVPVVGTLLGPQGGSSLVNGKEDAAANKEMKEPPLGKTFCANVFGHYVLAHELMPLLHSTPENERSASERARVIWMSSLEALDDSFTTSDLQGLQAHDPYRSAKRLTDILALTAHLPAVRRIAAPWFAVPESTMTATPAKSTRSKVKQDESDDLGPEIYVAHPGICHTSILELPTILLWCKLLAFYLARFFGSVWHPVSSYKGAVAPTWLVLSSQSTLDELEGLNGGDGGKTKWGSSTDWLGEERVRRTWTDGWGLTGRVGVAGEFQRKGTKRDAVELTKDAREDFEEVGRRAWADMESLRVQWEDILKK